MRLVLKLYTLEKDLLQSRHLASGLPVWRLRHHGLIQRIPGTFRYQVTDTGLRTARYLTRVHDRLLRTGLAEITDPNGDRSPLPRRWARMVG